MFSVVSVSHSVHNGAARGPDVTITHDALDLTIEPHTFVEDPLPQHVQTC